MWETQVQTLGGEDFLEKEMATHSSTLAWKIPWIEEPHRLQSMGLQKVGREYPLPVDIIWPSAQTRTMGNITNSILIPLSVHPIIDWVFLLYFLNISLIFLIYLHCFIIDSCYWSLPLFPSWPILCDILISFLYRCYESESEVAQLCPTLCDPMDCSL